MKRILMILTSHQQMENTESKTGVWLGEFTDPYYEFIDQGYQVTLASPLGGKPPVDGISELTEHITGSNRRFADDEFAQHAFAHTHTLFALSAQDFDAVFFPGGHGPLWDLAIDEISGKLINDFFLANKPVAAVCHGPAALIKAAELVPGLLSGKRLTGFTNAEETLVGRADHIPFKLENKLLELGADFKSALMPFLSHVETDGLLITGQNPLSAGPVAEALIEVLENGTVN